ncbi:MAG: ACR3 family arsenite efflux transporter, partial [Nocardia sp.]|nr:ACR3 family arsenite efflux transporter [Nocardia sp.]
MSAAVGAPAPRLPMLDRLLPVWIGIAMAAGLALGRLVPGLGEGLSAVEVDGISLPIAAGLLIMMYPVLAKVHYDRLGAVTGDRRLLAGSLALNWVIGPALMFALAWLLLPDLPEYRTGLIIVGLARCIAMVIIWNDLACGDREAAAVLVAINSIFQVLMFAVLGWFYLSVLPGWLGLEQATIEVSPVDIAVSVLVFLGIPLAAGYLTRRIGEGTRGRDWYETRLLPKLGPWALYGLLFTIVILFALQGEQITARPLDVARIAVPLLIYF